MKPLNLTTIVEDQIINKILVNRGAAINILPKYMLRGYGEIVDDLIPHNTIVSDFCEKASGLDGVICLDVFVGSWRRPNVFVMVSSQESFNMLLEREWIHGMSVVPLTVHHKIFFLE